MKVLDRHAVSRGAAIGLLLFVPVSAVRILVDRNVNDFDHSGWASLFFVALLAIYGVAGFVAARIGRDAPLSNGIVGAVGALVLWLPIRVLIWAVRDSSQNLFAGRDPVFTPQAILGGIVFAAFFGAIGGYISARRSRAAAPPSDTSGALDA